MNRCCLTVICSALLVAFQAFGQGQINFNNIVSTANPPVNAKIYFDSVFGFSPSGTDSTFRAALLGGPTNGIPSSYNFKGNLSLLASPYTAATWTTFRTGANAGYVAVGTDGARDSGLPYGSTGMFQVVFWQGTETTWNQAYADFQAGLISAGGSNPLILTTSQSVNDPNIPNLVGLTSFSRFVPEPTAFNLMVLGFGSWLLYQRRRTT
jgi:hypothetical protein